MSEMSWYKALNIYVRRDAGETEDRESYSISGNIGKAFGLGKTKLSLNSYYSWSNYYLLINKIPTPQHSNDKSVSFTYFSDLSVFYRTNSIEAGITCNNICGAKEFKRKFFTDNLQSYTITRLRPREIICQVRFSL